MSPENVGMDRIKIYQWKNEYLRYFGDEWDIFNVDHSLYDMSNIIYNSNKIVLR